MNYVRSMCLILAVSLAASASPRQTANAFGTHPDAKVTAYQCRNQILSLKDEPQSYFDAVPKRRLRSLNSLAESCGAVSELTVQEESDIGGILVLIENDRSNRVQHSPLGQVPTTASAEPSDCHLLVVSLNKLTTRFEPIGLQTKINVPKQGEVAWMEEQMARTQQMDDWQEQLGRCIVQTPEQLSIKDWQLAVFAYARLEEESNKISVEFADIAQKDASKALNGIYKDQDQQRLNDYNSLVHKYNTLVRDYNAQRDLLIRLSATPIALPPSPTFVHCETFVAGSIGTIDCY